MSPNNNKLEQEHVNSAKHCCKPTSPLYVYSDGIPTAVLMNPDPLTMLQFDWNTRPDFSPISTENTEEHPVTAKLEHDEVLYKQHSCILEANSNVAETKLPRKGTVVSIVEVEQQGGKRYKPTTVKFEHGEEEMSAGGCNQPCCYVLEAKSNEAETELPGNSKTIYKTEHQEGCTKYCCKPDTMGLQHDEHTTTFSTSIQHGKGKGGAAKIVRGLSSSQVKRRRTKLY
mmetsp:Transcript_14174/g.25092  ORF Transcript_14174/g.25092 Transcript_14174/m.25092 type:complete len:228 (+) Transcript_14174:183-866(+)